MKEISRKRQDNFAYKAEKKALEALNTEWEKLRQWNRNSPDYYIELDEPLRLGFKRNLVFKNSAVRRNDYPVLQELLPLLDREYHSATRDFSHKFWEGRRVRGRNQRQLVHIAKTLNQTQFNKLSEQQKEYFHLVEHIQRFGSVAYFIYRFVLDHLLESKLSNWFVTRVPRLDPDAQSRRDELYNKLHGRGQVWARYTYLRSRHVKFNIWPGKYRATFLERQKEREANKAIRAEWGEWLLSLAP